MSTECLATHERLSPDTRQRVADRRNQQEYCSRDQGGVFRDHGQPLDDGHDEVDGSAHVVGLEAADEAIECGGGWADSEEKGDLDEEDYEGGDAIVLLVLALQVTEPEI